MKLHPFTFYLLVAIAPVVIALAADAAPLRSDIVQNKETAVAIASAIGASLYGRDVINQELPLQAQLRGNIWFIKGTFHGALGGVMEMQMSKTDARIISLMHGK